RPRPVGSPRMREIRLLWRTGWILASHQLYRREHTTVVVLYGLFRTRQSVPLKILSCAAFGTPQTSSMRRYSSSSRSNSSRSPLNTSEPKTSFSNALVADFGVCGLTTLVHQKMDLKKPRSSRFLESVDPETSYTT